jgi:methionyl-tRNA synthetase
MIDERRRFYVTTPIYYVTAKPHLGSLYSTLLADVMARWHRLQGQEVMFLTGTDEHGQKIAQAAEQAGKGPQEFIDALVPSFADAWQKYEIGYTQFIRTSSARHKAGAQAFVKRLLETGDVYKSRYEGWYCTPCETFVLQKDQAISTQGDVNVLLCGSCGRATHFMAEETYFFRLSAYQDKLLAFYQAHPDFITPRERTNEVIAFVKEGLKDLSISRTTVSWGVPFPEDPAHTIYVWTEALCNYITALGYGVPSHEVDVARWWPADLQVLGKDIIRFHAVYWPAMLMAAGMKPPRRLLVHGWIKVNQQKMSKSLGNVVDPLQLYATYGADPVRYYLCRQIPVNQDGDFSIEDLEQRITSDLANDLGNLLNRMILLADKYNVFDLPIITTWSVQSLALRSQAWDMVAQFERHMQACEIHLALASMWRFIHAVNAYFHEKQPWKIAAQDKHAFIEVLSATAHSLRTVAVLLWPVMPSKTHELLASLGHRESCSERTLEDLELGTWHHAFLLKKSEPLFVKPQPQEPEESKEKHVEQTAHIAIEDFAKVELHTGTITLAERVAGSDKLIRLMVDFGPLGERQVLTGMGKAHAPEHFMGKQGIFVTNFKPRKMMGLESQGMLLAADSEEGIPALLMPEARVANGTRIK